MSHQTTDSRSLGAMPTKCNWIPKQSKGPGDKVELAFPISSYNFGEICFVFNVRFKYDNTSIYVFSYLLNNLLYIK